MQLSQSGPARATESSGSFVGRVREMAALVRQLETVAAGRGSVVLIAGEAGIGKTRLAQELAEAARVRGCRVLSGRCWEVEMGAPPLWPWVEALSDYVRSMDVESLRSALQGEAVGVAQVVPEIHRMLPAVTRPASVDSEDARFQLFGAIADFVRRLSSAEAIPLAGEQPRRAPIPSVSSTLPNPRALVVLLDDLQWADEASLLFLRYIAREIESMPVLVVGTYRDTPADAHEPLRSALTELQREPAFMRLPLEGLSDQEMQTFVEARQATAVPGDRRFARVLRRWTEGNPYFAIEILNHMAERGAVHEDGLRSLGSESLADLDIPASVRGVIERRLALLSEQSRQILGIAATLGRDFEVTLLSDVTAVDSQPLDDALREAEEAELIISFPHGDLYRFAHALVRETLYSELTARRRRQLHEQVGEWLEARHGESAEHAAELAYHFAQAGADAKAFHFGERAGRQAEAAAAWEDAIHQYERCLGLISNAKRESEKPALLVALGRCYRNANEQRAAWRHLTGAISAYVEVGDSIGMARATIETLRIASPPARRLSLTDAALAALGPEAPQLRAQLLLHRAALTGADGDIALARKETSTSGQPDSLRMEPALSHIEANGLLVAGRPDEARRNLRLLFERCDAAGMRGWALNALVSESAIPLFAGSLDEGVASIWNAVEYARKFHNRVREAGLLTWLAGTALARGEVDRYASLLEQANAVNPANFSSGWLRAVRCEIDGDPAQALALMPAPERAGGLPLWAAVIHGAFARIRFHTGDRAMAIAELARWQRHWSPFRVTDGNAGYLHTLASIDDALPMLGTDDVVDAAYAELNRWSWARFAPANLCGLDQLRGGLALRLGQLDVAEGHYSTGLEWAEREGCLVEAGRCLLGLARLAEKRGDHSSAASWLERANALLEARGANLYLAQASATVPLPARGGPPDRAGLSPREIEVLRLIATGRTNQEISSQLSISTNTVARHITHIFTKTDSANRAQAVSFGYRHELI